MWSCVNKYDLRVEALVGFHVSGFLEEMIVSELSFVCGKKLKPVLSCASSSQILMDKELNQQLDFKHWLTGGLIQYCKCINTTY